MHFHMFPAVLLIPGGLCHVSLLPTSMRLVSCVHISCQDGPLV